MRHSSANLFLFSFIKTVILSPDFSFIYCNILFSEKILSKISGVTLLPLVGICSLFFLFFFFQQLVFKGFGKWIWNIYFTLIVYNCTFVGTLVLHKQYHSLAAWVSSPWYPVKWWRQNSSDSCYLQLPQLNINKYTSDLNYNADNNLLFKCSFII